MKAIDEIRNRQLDCQSMAVNLKLNFLEQGAEETDCDFILRVLKVQGYITRNFLLQRFISRGSARIWDLRHMGYNIVGKNEKTHNGMDYRYTLIGEQE